MEELVLCQPRRQIEGVVEVQGIEKNAKLVQHFDSFGSITFLRRSEVESDEEIKQLIPYVVIEREGKILVYGRREGDARLRDKISVGIGGHVNPCDEEATVMATVTNAAFRELDEEIDLDQARTSSLDFMAFINDEVNSVSRVHFGFLFVVHLLHGPSTRHVTAKSKENVVLGWYTPGAIREKFPGEKVELWSQHVVRFLDQNRGWRT